MPRHCRMEQGYQVFLVLLWVIPTYLRFIFFFGDLLSSSPLIHLLQLAYIGLGRLM